MKKYLHITLILMAAGLIMPVAAEAQKAGTTVTVVEKKGSEVTAKEKAELQKLTEQQKKEIEQQKKEIEEQLRSRIEVLQGDINLRHLRSGEVDFYLYGQNSQSRGMPRTTWDFSRTMSENSSAKEYSFEVEKEMKNLSMSISGMCKTGEIRIDILMPGNRSYSEVVIDEYGSLNWRKSFELNEDSKDKVGIWKFKVATKNASGNFRISLSAN